MRLAWRSLIPVTLAVLLATAVVVFLDWPLWVNLVANVLIFFAVVFLGRLIPAGPPVNRRVQLEGSRFSAPPQ
jgi:hypothetical protein